MANQVKFVDSAKGRPLNFEFLFNTVQMFVDQQDFFYMLDKDGTACSAHLECIAICAVEILLFQNAQNFTKVSHLTSQTRACSSAGASRA